MRSFGGPVGPAPALIERRFAKHVAPHIERVRSLCRGALIAKLIGVVYVSMLVGRM